MTIRYDSATLKARFDDNGYMHDEPVVARVGILNYRNADGTPRRELRLPEDVFRADSLEAFAGMPITIGHRAMINPKNYKAHGVGTCLGSGRQDEGLLRVGVVVHDHDAIEQAKAKKIAGLSVGYNIDYEPRAGHWNEKTGEVKFDDERGDEKTELFGKEWQRFDGLQRNIRPNHLALVRSGRAGTIARLNLDGDEDLDYDPDETHNPVKNMTLIRLDSGAEVEVDQAVADTLNTARTALQTEKQRADSAEAEQVKLNATVGALKDQIEGHAAAIEQARLDAAEQIKQRASLVASAEKFGVKATEDMTDEAIKKAVVGKHFPKVNLDALDEVNLNTRFDIALEFEPSPMHKQRSTLLGLNAQRVDNSEGGSAEEARQRMIEKQLTGGK